MLIGLAGYARSGKDTVASMLGDYERKAFADPIRESLMALNPLLTPTEHLADVVKRQGWDEAKVNYPEVRRLMQVLGTEVGRRLIDPNIWVHLALRGIRPSDDVVFTDVRFQNEAIAIRNMGGQVWRVNRPGIEAVNSHSSETAMDGWKYDRVINNYGSLEELRSQLPVMM